MASAPQPAPEVLQLNRSSLRAVRLSAICSLLGILIPSYVLLLRDEVAFEPLAIIVLSPLWLPYLWVWWRLRQTSEARRAKKALALAVVWSLFVLLYCLLFLFLAASEDAWQFGIPLSVLGLLQITLLASSIKTYYSIKREQGEWKLLAMPVGFTILVFIAMVMIPHLTVSAVAHNEASSVGSLRTINKAQDEHAKLHPDRGFAASLAELVPTPGDSLFDSALASGVRSGYVFTLTAGAPDSNGRISRFTATARPRRYRRDGFRSFFIDETGIIRYTTEGRAPNAQDPPL